MGKIPPVPRDRESIIGERAMKQACIFAFLTLWMAGAAYGQPVLAEDPPEGSVRVVNGSLDAETGFAIAPIGNFNGDDRPDFAIGEPFNDRVRIVSPRPNTGLLNLNNFRDSVGVFGRQGSGFGFSVSGIGDFDGDGFEDLAIGAPFEGLGGRVYVLNGTNLLRSDITVDNVDEFILILEGEPGDTLGQSLGNRFNADGNRFAELLVPSPLAFTDIDGVFRSGAVHVVYGQMSFDPKIASIGDFQSGASLTILGPDSSRRNVSQFGSVIQNVGDFTGDGADDIAFFEGMDLESESGGIVILPGGAARTGRMGIEEIGFATSSLRIKVFPFAEMHALGALTGADLNGGGRRGLVFGFPQASLDGETGAKGVVMAVSGPETPGADVLIDSIPHQDAYIAGHWLNNSGLGGSLSFHNGLLAAGAPRAAGLTASVTRPGAAYLLRASEIRFGGVDANIADAAAGAYYGRKADSRFGQSVFLLNDINRDGVDDLFVNSHLDNEPETGAAAYFFPISFLGGDLDGDGALTAVDVFRFAAGWSPEGERGRNRLLRILPGFAAP